MKPRRSSRDRSTSTRGRIPVGWMQLLRSDVHIDSLGGRVRELLALQPYQLSGNAPES
jgi:hypothetical protein